METFIKASTFKFEAEKEVIDNKKISKFIEKFNEAIRTGKSRCSDAFTFTNTVDKIPVLNETEYKKVYQLAKNRVGN